MGQIWVEVEENGNAEYTPTRVYETRGEVNVAAALRVSEVPGADGPHEIVGWSSEGGGAPADVTYAPISDSGAAVSILIAGRDFGIRMRQAGSTGAWSLDNDTQRGEPYMLLPPDVVIEPMSRRQP